MKFCMKCGKELPDDAMFCYACGTPFSMNAQQKQENVSEEVPKTVQAKMCPQCGYQAKSYQAICPYCWHEFSNVSSSEAVKKLKSNIDNLERKRKKTDFGIAVEKIGKINLQKNDNTDEKINMAIRTCDVPGKPVDTYEIICFAATNIKWSHVAGNAEIQSDSKKVLYERNDAWRTLMDQAYGIAKSSFGDTPPFDQIDEFYKIAIAKIDKEKREVFGPVVQFKEQLADIENEKYEKEKKAIFAKKKTPQEEQQLAAQKALEIENKTLDLIRNFHVPNTQEDVFEFMNFAVSSINVPLIYGNVSFPSAMARDRAHARNKAWIDKINQIYQNARLSFGNTEGFERIDNTYNRVVYWIKDAEHQKMEKQKKQTKMIVEIIVTVIIFIIIVAFAGFILGMMGFSL
ncbi:MAG: zinc ribbon domain-containing protein [Lachnospiraceae bacterium]|nr:zinc ribbon domain-containing protein [Lachnospiraceae bacterium]